MGSKEELTPESIEDEFFSAEGTPRSSVDVQNEPDIKQDKSDGNIMTLEEEFIPKNTWSRTLNKATRLKDNPHILKDIQIFHTNSLQPPPPNVHVVAEFSYTARELDELNLVPGDILIPSSMLEPGWWVGKMVLPMDLGMEGKVGIFPANFVKCFAHKNTMERNTA